MKNPCFASDNTAGAHPAILQAVVDANTGYVPSYGEDELTAQATARLRAIFGGGSEAFLVYNGTGANCLAAGALLRSWQAVIASDISHMATDETGAPEKFTGCKVLTVPAAHGRIRWADVEAQLGIVGVQHHSQPSLLSLSNTTEVGTLYTPDEVRALAAAAHAHGMLLHVDGSRIANAAAALGMGFREITADCGVDVLSFGATKNGMLMGEAVVFLNGLSGADFPYVRKHGLQLHSKMRFLAAQMIAYLQDDLWLMNARHANAMAVRLRAGLESLPGTSFAEDTQANAVFAFLPPAMLARLEALYDFHGMPVGGGATAWRFMCSWATTEAEIDEFLRVAKG